MEKYIVLVITNSLTLPKWYTRLIGNQIIQPARWGNNKGVFTNIFDAIEYTNKYLGTYGPLPVEYVQGTLWDYSGYGDMIGIVKT